MAKATKTATNRQISNIGDFKQRIGGIVELPSGFTVRVKNPGGLRVFLNAGTIPNSLMSIVQDAMDKGKRITEEDIMKDGQLDPQQLADMMALNDQVALKTIIEPPLYPVPEDEADRQDDRLYVDELPDEDKLFLFQWVTGGARNLERFRAEYQASMDAGQASGSNVSSAE